MPKKKSIFNTTIFFTIKQAIRLSALFYGLLYSSKVLAGLHFGDELALLIFCVILSLADIAVRPVLKIVCLPLDILSFGMARNMVYVLLFTAFLGAGFLYLPELKLTTTSIAQNVQLALAVWIYTLTILTATR
jgi:uncharacterized membrane protein YvlD (DUF360 family)